MVRMTAQTQAVLAALLEAPTEAHYGLEIAGSTKLSSGTLYPILARLEQAGWVESHWEEIDPRAAGRRPRRYYWLTAEGEVAATRELEAAIERLRRAVPSPGRVIRAPA